MTPDLDLRRKVCLAIGWKQAKSTGRWITPAGEFSCLLVADLPPIELSNGLALDVLVEFLKTLPDDEQRYKLTQNLDGTTECQIGWKWTGKAETPALAICRAIVQAKERA